MNSHTWSNDWNYIIRNVFYADDQLKRLMKVPYDIGIIQFIDRYFIRAGFSNSLLTDEPVRIVYGNVYSVATQDPHVKQNEMSFDIYVKREYLHNVEDDRLVLRTQRIAERIYELLTKNRYTKGYRFWLARDVDLGTTTVGYVRKNISLDYMRVY